MAFQDAIRIFLRNDPAMKGYLFEKVVPTFGSDVHVIGHIVCPRKHMVAWVDDTGAFTNLSLVRVELADPMYFTTIKKICNHVICVADPDWKRYDASDDIQWMDDLLKERDGNP